MCPGDSEIIRLLAGELGEAEAQRVRGHVAVCEACRQRLAEYQTVWSQLGAADIAPEHRDLTASILAAASNRSISNSRMRIAAAVLLAIGAGVVAGSALPVARPVAQPDLAAAAQSLGLDVLATDDSTGLIGQLIQSDTAAAKEPS